VTLCDAGPLIAIINEADENHARCVAELGHLPAGPLVTTWPCLTEAMYMVGRKAGFRGQEVLWSFLEFGPVVLDAPESEDTGRLRRLMRQYKDTPMDFADASLVAAAERLEIQRVFTVDRHFRAYRIHGRHAFEVVP
jgi:uncharacterized protein